MGQKTSFGFPEFRLYCWGGGGYRIPASTILADGALKSGAVTPVPSLTYRMQMLTRKGEVRNVLIDGHYTGPQ
jgi:hypothetical protein